MDPFRNTSNLNREELLQLAQKYNIRISSRISECILRADIENALIQSGPTYPGQLGIRYSQDKLARSYIIMGGINVNIVITPELILTLRQWLREYQVPEQYILDGAILSSVGVVIWERGLPTPRSLWYERNVAIVQLFMMSLENYREVYNKFGNITPEETIKTYTYQTPEITRGSIPVMKDAIASILIHQSAEHLAVYARTLPPNGTIYFETKPVLLDYIFGKYIENIESILTFFSNLHKNAYVHREEYLRYYSTNIAKPTYLTFPFYIYVHSEPRYALACPPTWFEQRILRGLLNLDVYNLSPFLTERIPSSDDVHTIIKWLFSSTYADPSFTPNREQIADIVQTRSKDFLRIPITYLRDLIQWSPFVPVAFTSRDKKGYFDMILNNLQTPMFFLVRNSKNCPNQQDNLLEDFNEELAITFGTFTDFHCYSPEELFESIIVNVPEGYARFRIPDRPNETFTSPQVKQLHDLLQDKRDLIRYYKPRLDRLFDKITSGAEFLFGLEELENLVRTISDRNGIIRLFTDLFEAGMYQRRWSGTGPYPMTFAETRGGTQSDVDVRMTPVLNQIRDIYNGMSVPDKAIIDQLPMMNYTGYFFDTEYKIIPFINLTCAGDFCVGYGQAYMVYTGYFYLRALGVQIFNFNLGQFEATSTHRA